MSNEEKVTGNEQKVMSNEQKVMNNKQKVTSNEQQAKSSTSLYMLHMNLMKILLFDMYILSFTH